MKSPRFAGVVRYVRALAGLLLFLLLPCGRLRADQDEIWPRWWRELAVEVRGEEPRDYAPAAIGQMKWMLYCGLRELQIRTSFGYGAPRFQPNTNIGWVPYSARR